MSSLASREIRRYLLEFCPTPGYVLKLTRKKFEELVEDTIDVDISEQTESNGNRLKLLLKSSTDEQVTDLVNTLRELSAST